MNSAAPTPIDRPEPGRRLHTHPLPATPPFSLKRATQENELRELNEKIAKYDLLLRALRNRRGRLRMSITKQDTLKIDRSHLVMMARARKSRPVLPPMSKQQRKQYNALRAKYGSYTRAQALAVLGITE